MDVMVIRESGDTCTIELKLENRLIALERPNLRRMTDEDQKNLFSGDKGFEFIADLQDKELVWGKSS
jgi:predicted rRNA methylase YqxC with S4 and FtsJ domains